MDSYESRSSRPPAPPMDSDDISTFVLKITYLGVLRRLVLVARDVFEAKFSFSHLEIRARAIFSLSEAAPVTFTYVDSDGDVVAMTGDGDILDALVLQGLNPLRITMVDAGSKFESKYTPGVEEEDDDEHDLLQVPEDFDGSLDGVEENEGSDHEEQGKMEGFVKGGEELTQRSDVLGEKDGILSVPSLERERKDDRPIEEEETSLHPSFQTPAPAAQAVRNEEIEFSPPLPPLAGEFQVEGGLDVKSDSSIAFEKDVSLKSLEDGDPTLEGLDNDGKGVVNTNPEVPSLPSVKASSLRSVGTSVEGDESESEGRGEDKDGGSNSQEAEEERRNVHHGIRCDGCGMNPITGPRFKSCKRSNYDLCLGCFAGRDEVERAEYVDINRRFFRLVDPSFDFESLTNAFGLRNTDDSSSQSENSANEGMRVLHPGVQCDECGVTPITGPRFKSSKRFNYDLCLSCYERSGSDDKEYSCLNLPTPSKGLNQITPLVSKILRLADQKLTSICERCVRIFDPSWAPNLDQGAGKDDDMPLLEASEAEPESTANVGAEEPVVDPPCAPPVVASDSEPKFTIAVKDEGDTADSVSSSSDTKAIGAKAESAVSSLTSMNQMHILDIPAFHMSQKEQVEAEASKTSSSVDQTESNTDAAFEFAISSKLKELVGLDVDAPSIAESSEDQTQSITEAAFEFPISPKLKEFAESNTEAAFEFPISSKLKELVGLDGDASSATESSDDRTESNTEAAFEFLISSKRKELAEVEVDAPSTAESHGQEEIDSPKRNESCSPEAAPETESMNEVNVPDFKVLMEVSRGSWEPRNLDATGDLQAGGTEEQTGENVDEEEKQVMKFVETECPDEALQHEKLVRNSDASPRDEDLGPFGKFEMPEALVLTDEEWEDSEDESENDSFRAPKDITKCAERSDDFAAEFEQLSQLEAQDVSSLQKLMANLKSMGFSDEALNKQLLEKHDLDLRKTLDDLCEADDWDQMLGDLQEMGFYD